MKRKEVFDMAVNSLKYIAFSIFFVFIFLFLYSLSSYELILKNIYINSYMLAGVFSIIFVLVYLTLGILVYRSIFQKEERKRFVFFVESILPILLLSFGLGFLSNVYNELNYTNYQITKAGKFVAKNVASFNGSEEEISNSLKSLMDDVLRKQGVNVTNLSYSFKLPTKTTNYGDSFIIEVRDARKFYVWKNFTLMPLPKDYTWRFFYNFMNKSEANGNNRVISQVNYSTPYDDFRD